MVRVELDYMIIKYERGDRSLKIDIIGKHPYEFEVFAVMFDDEDGRHYSVDVYVKKRESISYNYGWSKYEERKIETVFYGTQFAKKRFQALEKQVKQIIKKVKR